MKDERFFPATQRETKILERLTGNNLETYKRLRHQGKTVMEALQLTDENLHAEFKERNKEG